MLLFFLLLGSAAGLSRGVLLPRSQVLRAGLGLSLSPLISSARTESDLPDGAFQFDRFIKVQGEWNRLGARLKDPSQLIDDREWDALGLFLRKLYDEGEDMTFLAQNLDKEKKTSAKSIATNFRSAVKAADRPTRNQDRDAVLSSYNETAMLMTSFLELLQDVPDEL